MACPPKLVSHGEQLGVTMASYASAKLREAHGETDAEDRPAGMAMRITMLGLLQFSNF